MLTDEGEQVGVVDTSEVLALIPLSLEENARRGETEERTEEMDDDGASDVSHLQHGALSPCSFNDRRFVSCLHEGFSG